LSSLDFSPSFPSALLCRKDSWKPTQKVSLTVSWPGHEPGSAQMRLPTSSSTTSSSDAPRRNLCRLMCLSSYDARMSQAASDHMWANVELGGGNGGAGGGGTSCDRRQTWGETQDVQMAKYSGLCWVLRTWDWHMSSCH
jgi:hypothetical protein